MAIGFYVIVHGGKNRYSQVATACGEIQRFLYHQNALDVADRMNVADWQGWRVIRASELEEDLCTA